MTDEYTPTTEEVRRACGDVHCGDWDAPHAHGCPEEAEFDRWLAAYTREVAAKAWDEGAKAMAMAMANAVAAEQTVTYIAPHNPYRKETA